MTSSSVKKRLRELFVGSDNSLGGKARERRARWLMEAFPRLCEMHVVDLGGTCRFWESLPERPASVVALNMFDQGSANQADQPDWFDLIQGDACNPPSELFDRKFDLVFSNSTIEHVGDRVRRAKFAQVVHQLAPNHWIQTPNKAFPLEPHTVFPFEQFLPRSIRGAIYTYWPLLHTKATSLAKGCEMADEVELLRRSEMRTLFPASCLAAEVLVPLIPPKSFIAVASEHRCGHHIFKPAPRDVSTRRASPAELRAPVQIGSTSLGANNWL